MPRILSFSVALIVAATFVLVSPNAVSPAHAKSAQAKSARAKSENAKRKAKSARKTARKTAAPKTAAPKSKDGKKELARPIRRLIGAIRYNKDAMALKQFDGPAQTAYMLARNASKFTAAQKTEFINSFHQMFAKIAFPRVRADFQKLETILYDEPRVSGNKATIGATIVILHPAKKQEIGATFDLIKRADGWKVVDVTIKGDKSMLTNVRDGQIGPILQEGGPPHLLGLMRKRLASLPK